MAPYPVTSPPPGVTPQRWAVLVAQCRQYDDRVNHGAGSPRTEQREDED